MRTWIIAAILAFSVTSVADAATYQAIYSGRYVNETPGAFGISPEGDWSLKFSFADSDVFVGLGANGDPSGPTVDFLGDLTIGAWTGKAIGRRQSRAGSDLGSDGNIYYWSYDYLSISPVFDWAPPIEEACSPYVSLGHGCGGYHVSHTPAEVWFYGESTDPIGGMFRSSPRADEPYGPGDPHYTYNYTHAGTSDHRVDIAYFPGDNWAPSVHVRYYLMLDQFDVSAVPEPATWAMMIIGFGGVGAMVRGSRRRNALSAA